MFCNTFYLVKIGVGKSNMVVAGNAVSKSRETFLDSLDHNFIRQTVPQVLKLCQIKKKKKKTISRTQKMQPYNTPHNHSVIKRTRDSYIVHSYIQFSKKTLS